MLMLILALFHDRNTCNFGCIGFLTSLGFNKMVMVHGLEYVQRIVRNNFGCVGSIASLGFIRWSWDKVLDTCKELFVIWDIRGP